MVFSLKELYINMGNIGIGLHSLAVAQYQYTFIYMEFITSLPGQKCMDSFKLHSTLDTPSLFALL